MGWAKKTAKKVSKDLAKFDDKIIQPVIKTVEKVVEDPKLLAAVAISVLAPGVGTAIGSALGLGSGVAATVVGNTIVNTALNGGDVKKALVSAVIPVAGAEVAKVATTAFVDLGLSDALAKSVGTATAKAVVAEVTGQDAKTAFIGSVAGSAVNAATSSIDAFKDLPKPLQQAVNAGITSELTGGDGAKAATNALVSSGISSLRAALKDDTPTASKETPVVADAGIPQQLVNATEVDDSQVFDPNTFEVAEAPTYTADATDTEIPEFEPSAADLEAQKEGWPGDYTRRVFNGDIAAYKDETAKRLGWPDDATRQYAQANGFGNEPFYALRAMQEVSDKKGLPAVAPEPVATAPVQPQTEVEATGLPSIAGTEKPVEPAPVKVEQVPEETKESGLPSIVEQPAPAVESEEELYARLPPEIVKNLEWLKNNPGPYSQVLPHDPLEPVEPPETVEPAPVEPVAPASVRPEVAEMPRVEAPEPGPIATADVGQSKPVGETFGYDPNKYPVQNFGVPADQNMDSYQQTLKEIYDNGGLTSQWMPNGDGTNTIVNDDGSTVTINEKNEIVYTTPATDNEQATTPAPAKPTTPKPAAPTIGGTTAASGSTSTAPKGDISQNIINAAAAGLLTAGAVSALDSLTSETPQQQAVARDVLKMDWNQQNAQPVQRGIAYGQQFLNPKFTKVKAAAGGLMSLAGGGMLGSYSDGGRLLRGPGDGMSDNIPASIANKQPARLADGEFVIPADVVSHLGNGSTEAGSRVLYEMMNRVRKARTGNPKQGKQIKPQKFMPK